MSIYTGRDKATVENHLNFVSVRHKQNEASVYCQGFVMLCRIASSVDSVTDYNGFCCILSRRDARAGCRHGESHVDAGEH